jgi:hypothetical protein
MDLNYYKENFHLYRDLKDQATEKKVSFFQNILIASSSMTGILVALHNKQPLDLYIRLVFVLGVLLLVLGILTVSITLYDYTNLAEQKAQDFHKELQTALKSDRKLNEVTGRWKKGTLFCEKYSLLFLIIGLFVLVVYTCIVTIFIN